MPVLLAVLGAIGAGLFWYARMRAAGETARDLVDAANDVRLAARRLGYRIRRNDHPADAVDDARIAAAGIVFAIAEMEQMVTQAGVDAFLAEARSRFGVNHEEAEEITAVGRWVAQQCQTKAEAVRRLSKRLRDLAGAEALPDLEAMIDAVADPGGRGLSEVGADALATLRRVVAPH
ncbi:MAG: hypothetical protein AAGE18_05690 [Pseudomonadota bacterium]